MNQDKKTIEALKDILKEIQYIEYEDSDNGLEYFCPICFGRPTPETLSRGTLAMYPDMKNGKGHDKDCKLARAIYGA